MPELGPEITAAGQSEGPVNGAGQAGQAGHRGRPDFEPGWIGVEVVPD